MGFFDKLFGGGRSGEPITAADLDARTFTVTALREGYDSHEVSDFLDLAVATLAAYERGETHGPDLLTARQVVEKRFTQTKFRSGWDQGEVDDALDDVAVTLRQFEGQFEGAGESTSAG